MSGTGKGNSTRALRARLRPVEIGRLVDAALKSHTHMLVASNDWSAAPPDDHKNDKWRRHTAVEEALWVAIEHFAKVDAVLTGTSRVTLQTRHRFRLLIELAYEFRDLRKGKVGPLLRPAQVGGTKAPTEADWERRATITSAIEMAKRSGLTYPKGAEHVAHLLPGRVHGKTLLKWRKEVLKRAKLNPDAPELKRYLGFVADWPALKKAATERAEIEQATGKRTTWQEVVRRSIPPVLKTIE